MRRVGQDTLSLCSAACFLLMLYHVRAGDVRRLSCRKWCVEHRRPEILEILEVLLLVQLISIENDWESG